jgi:hypothetical protein
VFQDGRNDARLALATERAPSGQHLVEDGTEREQIAPRVGLASFELLRRHVGHSAGQHALAARRLRDGGRHAAVVWRSVEFRQPKVEQLRARLRQHHIRRLQIAMHDAGAVRLVQRVADVDGGLQCLVARQRSALHAIAQGFAFETLHDQVVNRLP